MKQNITIIHTLTVRDLRYDFAKVDLTFDDNQRALAAAEGLATPLAAAG
jgi:hypothetical protein